MSVFECNCGACYFELCSMGYYGANWQVFDFENEWGCRSGNLIVLTTHQAWDVFLEFQF